jgi:Protein of unknown function (DUF3060)
LTRQRIAEHATQRGHVVLTNAVTIPSRRLLSHDVRSRGPVFGGICDHASTAGGAGHERVSAWRSVAEEARIVRMYSVRLIGGTAVALVSTATLVLAGCGSESTDTNTPTATAGTSGAQVEIGNTINYGSFGTTADIDCADGKSLNVGGANNTLTVRGSCANVNIGGSDNKITFERIDNQITVVGLNNTVTYSEGDPKVSDTGSGNTISKA